jgi:hypothetical protein
LIIVVLTDLTTTTVAFFRNKGGLNMLDTVLRNEGTKILIDALGLQNATRFFTIIQQEPFDYTKWQENLLEDSSIEEISKNAAMHRKNKI